jgi:CPA2 family monovalent cation:H+ antiporter-2
VPAFWAFLLEILVLLAVAMTLGRLCERFRQSAIVGYLLAGTLLGPNALQLFPTTAGVEGIVELGVALLLFSIGLEFNIGRLRSLGVRAVATTLRDQGHRAGHRPELAHRRAR